MCSSDLLLDVQFATPHPASMGAFTVLRADYLRRVRAAAAKQVDLRALRPDPFAGLG